MIRRILTALGIALAVAGAGCAAMPGTARATPPDVLDVEALPLDARVEIQGRGENRALDKAIVDFMVAQHVPNAQAAVSSGGATVFSHAYTYTGVAASRTTTKTIMRLASNSKAWVSAALYNLIQAGKIDSSRKVFQYLGITKPLPEGAHVDPRVYTITIQEMIDHKSGWDRGVKPYYDPTFSMRRTALALGLDRPITQEEEVRYQLHQPLQEPPGTKYAYCNFCYTVLGMVVAKASGMPFDRYVAERVAAPIGAGDVVLSPTVGPRLPGEIAKYYNRFAGRSAVYVTSNQRWPYPYGGDGLVNEVADGAAGLATSAESMLALMQHYVIWGVGPAPGPGAWWAREGEMPGTNTYAEQLPNGTHYAILVNTNQYLYSSKPKAFEALQSQIARLLDPAFKKQKKR